MSLDQEHLFCPILDEQILFTRCNVARLEDAGACRKKGCSHAPPPRLPAFPYTTDCATYEHKPYPNGHTCKTCAAIERAGRPIYTAACERQGHTESRKGGVCLTCAYLSSKGERIPLDVPVEARAWIERAADALQGHLNARDRGIPDPLTHPIVRGLLESKPSF